MAKDTYWFKHDSSARMDEKTLELRSLYGWEGYGIYWAIIETLRDQDGYAFSLSKLGGLAVALGKEREWTEKFVADCIALCLFKSDGEVFYSQSLRERMKDWDSMRERNSKAAGKSWESRRNADAMQVHSECNADAMPIRLDKSKVKENNTLGDKSPSNGQAKPNYTDGFARFWKSYPRPDKKAESFKVWKRDKLESRTDEIISKLEVFKTCKDWKKENGRFIPHGSTWLNQKRYDDDLQRISASRFEETI